MTKPSASTFELQQYVHSCYHDTYVYAITYDTETKEFGAVEFDGTSGCYSKDLRPQPATNEVIAEALEALENRIVESKIKAIVDNRYTPVVGVMGRSTTTRGKNVGVVGKIVWMGENSYKPGTVRIGIRVDGESKLRYIGADNVQTVEPVEPDADNIRARVRESLESCRHGIWYETLRSAKLICRL